jgi:predicted O-methyltransferase YrrM
LHRLDSDAVTPLEDRWTIDEPASSERELRDFLSAMIRLLKPELVVETGCYLGRATKAMAEALVLNGRGRLVTCDTDDECVWSTCQQLGDAGRVVAVLQCRGRDVPELREADLVFLDSDYPERRAEFELVKPGALVVIHDTRISYHSDIPPHEGWVREAGGILFDTHRGFGLVRKL